MNYKNNIRELRIHNAKLKRQLDEVQRLVKANKVQDLVAENTLLQV